MNTVTAGQARSSDNDAVLQEHLSNWTTLHYALSHADLTLADVERMVYLEAEGERRSKVLRRLLGRASRLRMTDDLRTLDL